MRTLDAANAIVTFTKDGSASVKLLNGWWLCFMSRELATAAHPLPVLAYHIPAVTHTNLTVDQMLRLLDIDGVVGFKVSPHSTLFTIIARTASLPHQITVSRSLITYTAMLSCCRAHISKKEMYICCSILDYQYARLDCMRDITTESSLHGWGVSRFAMSTEPVKLPHSCERIGVCVVSPEHHVDSVMVLQRESLFDAREMYVTWSENGCFHVCHQCSTRIPICWSYMRAYRVVRMQWVMVVAGNIRHAIFNLLRCFLHDLRTQILPFIFRICERCSLTF